MKIQFEKDIFAYQKLLGAEMNILKSRETRCEIKPKVAIVSPRASATKEIRVGEARTGHGYSYSSKKAN